MKSFYAGFPLLLVARVFAAPANGLSKRDTPKIYLAGDSTMALGGGGALTQGWGVYLPYSITGATVVNDAVAGRSARSYSNESRFDAIAKVTTEGDIVVIEFGHNDGGSLNPDNGRSDCAGSGNETCVTSAGVVVQTYVTYLTNAAKEIIAKGAKVVISSPTPDNICEGSACSYSPSRFTDYCRDVVKNAGSSATFVDHGQYLANEYISLGKAVVDAYYPKDHTHTSPEGANVVAAAFVKGLLCEGTANPLAAYIKNTTASVTGSCI